MSASLEDVASEQFQTAREGFSPDPIPRDLVTQIYALSVAESLKRIADRLDAIGRDIRDINITGVGT